MFISINHIYLCPYHLMVEFKLKSKFCDCDCLCDAIIVHKAHMFDFSLGSQEHRFISKRLHMVEPSNET